MNNLREIALDTETTGLYPKNGDKIIEIGCIELVNRVKTGKYYHTYINPLREINEEAFRIHGISSDFLQDKPIFAKIIDEFLAFIGSSNLVIHDIGFLNHELALQGYPAINIGKVVDTLKIARKKFPGAPASLDALCKKYNISLEARGKHGALIDAELLANVYIYLSGKGEQSSFSLAQLTTVSEEIVEVIRQYREPRVFAEQYPELKNHEEFIQAVVKDALWLTEKKV
jgi:DNA polymerase-3 subunit epsilon